MRHWRINREGWSGRLAAVCMIVGSHVAIGGCGDIDESAEAVDEEDREVTMAGQPLLFGGFAASCSDLRMEDNPPYMLYAQCQTTIKSDCTCLGHIGEKGFKVQDTSKNLDECMSNQNGDLAWGGGGFSKTCDHISVRQPGGAWHPWLAAKWTECGGVEGLYGIKCTQEYSNDVAQIHADCRRRDGSVWRDSWEDIEPHISNENGILHSGCGGL